VCAHVSSHTPLDIHDIKAGTVFSWDLNLADKCSAVGKSYMVQRFVLHQWGFLACTHGDVLWLARCFPWYPTSKWCTHACTGMQRKYAKLARHSLSSAPSAIMKMWRSRADWESMLLSFYRSRMAAISLPMIGPQKVSRPVPSASKTTVLPDPRADPYASAFTLRTISASLTIMPATASGWTKATLMGGVP
jgi:hypothetical protein